MTKIQTNRKKVEKKEALKKVEIKVEKKHSQIMKGRVVSAKTPMTVTVLVERKVMDPFYHKAFKRSKRFLAHDMLGAREGDIVEVAQIRPISKNKRFIVIKIVGRDIEAIVTHELKEKAAEAIEEAVPAGRQVMPEEPEKSDKSDEIEGSEQKEVSSKNKQSLRSEDLKESSKKKGEKEGKSIS